MNSYTFLPLNNRGRKLYLNNDKLINDINELEDFISGCDYMNSEEFSKNVLFSQEIKNNNTIEGYQDDVGLVYDIINNNLKIKDKEKMTRIKNLYDGYRFILNEKNITEDTLKKLYNILSKNLLTINELKEMGKYYRKNDVYIFYSSNILVPPDLGINSSDIDYYMNELFDFINKYSFNSSKTLEFIKSQIIHFQFVNVHPYYDINGRTARTTAMWYLLNKQIYPYIIFNRAISLNKNEYYKLIKNTKDSSNLTFYLKFLLDSVKLELEKEYIIDMIKSSSSNLTAVDYQSIYYILSIKSNLTLYDFTTWYNNHNDKKNIKYIYENMILPLLEKNIIINKGETKKNNSNFKFELNNTMYEVDPNKIKKLKL